MREYRSKASRGVVFEILQRLIKVRGILDPTLQTPEALQIERSRILTSLHKLKRRLYPYWPIPPLRRHRQMECSIGVRLDDRGDRVHGTSIAYTTPLVNPPFGPESAFERGFSITLDARGKIIRSIKEVAPDDKIRTKLKDGEIRSLRG